MKHGFVTKSTGSWYVVKTQDNETYEARIRGKFRLKGIKHTNPIAVGDEVAFTLDKEGNAVINEIKERKNYIIRRSVNLSKKTHIIASNIDLALLIATINHPKTSTGFIDRFLVTAEAYHIPAIIAFNKIDLLTEEEKLRLQEVKELYESIGYKVIEISALQEDGISPLINLLKDKKSVFSGHSGVGKSTLINTLHPHLGLKTKDISHFNKKGQHTTTFAEMYEWPFGGYIIDTPGIKEFGLVDFDKEEIQNLFPEIQNLRSECKFHNCMHLNEPKCAVKEAVENGTIHFSRFESYLTFLEETE